MEKIQNTATALIELDNLTNALKNARLHNENPEVKRLLSIALTDLEKAGWAIEASQRVGCKGWPTS